MNDKKSTIMNDKKVTIMNDKKVTKVIIRDKKLLVTIINDKKVTEVPRSLHAHNFDIYRNIGILHLKTVVLIRGIQLKKNFYNST